KSRHIGLDQDRLPSAGSALSGERRQRQPKAAGRAEMGRRSGRDFMQGAPCQPATQKSVGPAQGKRKRSIIMLIILSIFYVLPEARERVRGLRTGHEPLHRASG